MHVVTTEHNAAARAVNAQGQAFGGEDHWEQLHAEQALDVNTAFTLDVRSVHTNAALVRTEEQLVFLELVLNVVHFGGTEAVEVGAERELWQHVWDGVVLDFIDCLDFVSADLDVAIFVLRLDLPHALAHALEDSRLIRGLAIHGLLVVLKLLRLPIRGFGIFELRHDVFHQFLAIRFFEAERDRGQQIFRSENRQEVHHVLLHILEGIRMGKRAALAACARASLLLRIADDVFVARQQLGQRGGARLLDLLGSGRFIGLRQRGVVPFGQASKSQ
mmetsp:Transcript_34102/g.105375  ORF Transcript_34102/g.105375 Transcript_34102/m.105375 type:complete len:275 (-) Transcript_34102:3810-4634(-)